MIKMLIGILFMRGVLLHAIVGLKRWLLRLYDDPSWSFDAEEPMQPEKKISDELVSWVRYIDSASDKDSFARPREKSLYDVAIDLGATRCVELLQISESEQPEESTDMTKIGKEIFKSGNTSLGPASPNHPIYNRGFAIGERRLKPSSPAILVKNSKSEKNILETFKLKTEDDGGAS